MPDVAFPHRATGTELDTINHTSHRRFCRAEDDGLKFEWRTFESTPGIDAGAKADN